MKIYLIIIIALLTLSSAYAQDCSDLPLEINVDIDLCEKDYLIDKSIEITKDNIKINCNSASIRGLKTGTGFRIISKTNITLENCNISDFESGIAIEDSNSITLRKNIISQNTKGLFLLNSENIFLENNLFKDNGKDITNLTISQPEEEIQEENESIEESIPESEIIIEVDENTAEIYNEIKELFAVYINNSNQFISIERYFSYNDTENYTTVKLRIIPTIKAVNYSYYENIPKCMALYAKDIIIKNTNYKIIADDPLIMWSFADPIAQEEIISYKVKDQISEDCKKLLEGFGFATGFEEEQSKMNLSVIFGIIITFVVIIGIIYIKKNSE